MRCNPISVNASAVRASRTTSLMTTMTLPLLVPPLYPFLPIYHSRCARKSVVNVSGRSRGDVMSSEPDGYRHLKDALPVSNQKSSKGFSIRPCHYPHQVQQRLQTRQAENERGVDGGALLNNVMPLPPPPWPPFSSRLSDQRSAIDSIPTTSPIIGSALEVPSPTSATSSGSASTAKQTATHDAATGNGSLNSLVAIPASLVILSASYVYL
jgi:hypothetical protein